MIKIPNGKCFKALRKYYFQLKILYPTGFINWVFQIYRLKKIFFIPSILYQKVMEFTPLKVCKNQERTESNQ